VASRIFTYRNISLTLPQICSLPSLSSSFSPCGYPSAGLFSTSSLAPSLWFSRKTITSTSSSRAPCSLVSQHVHLPTNLQTNIHPAMCVGVIIITIISILQEKIAARFFKLPSSAESRLYFVCIESVLLPIGMFWFGWTSYSSVHWIVPTIAIGCAGMGIFSIYLATFNYLADTYHRYASSAIAAQSCCRNLLGGVFPLVTAAMFNNMGFPGASSLLGGIVSCAHPGLYYKPIANCLHRVRFSLSFPGFWLSTGPRFALGARWRV